MCRILASMGIVRIGTAGWNVPRQHVELCGAEGSSKIGSHLERYAAVLNCVEVNSSFYKPHRLATWARWAASVPRDFRFAVKAPKAVTHTAKLVDCGSLLVEFFEQLAGLGEKLGPVLFQFPPKSSFEAGQAREFFTTLREVYAGDVVLEPRHASWFTGEAERLLREYGVARVAADPPAGSTLAARPGGDLGLRYFRWHGSPRTYWSAYDAERLSALANELRSYKDGQSWVIFDNTASGAALANAVELMGMLRD